MILGDTAALDDVAFAKLAGLVPVVAQDAHTGEVLMVAFANREALELTLRERRMWYYSRSRGGLWRKGETSGNEQRVLELHLDCDRDTVLALVEPAGPACHTGSRSCFEAAPTLQGLADVIAQRSSEPASGSYTQKLLADQNLRLKKIGEESTELVLACAAGDVERTAEEAADLIYHALVACHATGVTAADVLRALSRRRGSPRRSTLEEDAVKGE